MEYVGQGDGNSHVSVVSCPLTGASYRLENKRYTLYTRQGTWLTHRVRYFDRQEQNGAIKSFGLPYKIFMLLQHSTPHVLGLNRGTTQI